MKHIILIIAGVFFTLTQIQAQNEVDALRYSQSYFGGTARSMAMGGAFGALGADLSAISYNPAGIAVYRSNEFSISPTLFIGETDADYFGSNYSDSKYNFNFNSIGIVGSYIDNDFVYKTDNNQVGWMNTNVAVGYNRMNNFHSSTLIEGVNPQSSMVDYFLQEAINNGSTVNEFNTVDGYADLIFDDLQTPYELVSDFSDGVYNQTQTRTIRTDGSIGEYFVAFGANYSHKLYLGGSLGIQVLRYEEILDHSENDVNDIKQEFESMNYHRKIDAKGSGINFKVGMIYRPIDMIRIGAAFHTPTFFNIEEESTYFIESRLRIDDVLYEAKSTYPINTFDYKVQTPLKFIGSIGFVVGKFGIISAEYELLDYSKTRMYADVDQDELNEVNKIIDEIYTTTSNIRVGGEFRNGPFRLRAGYGLYGSPYASNEENSGATMTTYSGGFGIKDEGFFFDVAYVYSVMNEKYFLYGVEEANLDRTSNKIVATVGFRF